MHQEPCNPHPVNGTTGNTIPIVVGLAVMLLGLYGMLTGGLGLLGQDTERGQTTSTMALIGGLFLVLTGLWFMTRNGPTPGRVIGLIIMVCGVVSGTYAGLALVGTIGDLHIEVANGAFICGLLVHLLGVIYVVKAKE